MKRSALFIIRQIRRYRIALLSAVMLCGLAMLVVLGDQVRMELRLLRTTSQDNVQWNLSQLEVDLLVFNLALSDAAQPGAPETALSDVRKRFDVLFSRVNVLTDGPTYHTIRQETEATAALAEINSFLSDTVPIIDGPDSGLEQALLPLQSQMPALRTAARVVAINGISVFANIATEQRAFLSSLLLKISVLSGAMFLALGGALLILFRQFGIAARESRAKEQSNTRLRSMIGASLDGIVVGDSEGQILDFNAAATQIFGYSREEALGQHLVDLLTPEYVRAKHKEGMQRFVATGESDIVDAGLVEVVAMRRNGEEFPLEVSVASTEGPHGTIFVSFMRDISTRLKAQADLTDARDRALAADKAKSTFLAVMSHEMRTPLNGLIGTLDLFEATPLSEKQAQYLNVMRSSGTLLMHHINNVLDITKVEAGKLELADTPFAPIALAHEVADVSRPTATSRKTQIVLENTLPQSVVLLGDPFRIKQSLFNLVGNAIKFTSDGEVLISLSHVVDEDGSSWMEFRVTDTGIGIAKENLSRVFDDFVTIDTSYSRGAEGTGLGLGISKRMAEAMHGSIGVKSALGEGSTFWLRIPWREADTSCVDDGAAPPPAQIENDLSMDELPAGLSVLLVEDNEINRFVAHELLEGLGHTVTEAKDGLEGLNLANATRFDLVIMDISMPNMDGLTATREIRKSNGASSGAPIFGLTAHAGVSEQETFEQAGMQLCLTKPITRTKFMAALAQLDVETDVPVPHAPDDAPSEMLDHTVLSDLKDALGGDKFQTILQRFLSETGQQIAKLSPPNTPDAAQTAVKAVHHLAGSAAVVGASSLWQSLKRLEDCGKALEYASFSAELDALDVVWKETQETILLALAENQVANQNRRTR